MEKDFQREVIDRLARIETKQDSTAEAVSEHSRTISQHGERITVAEQSAKSAHHRINGIFATAGIFGGLAGTVANFIAAIWTKSGGGHG